jgi:hypothetical protein
LQHKYDEKGLCIQWGRGGFRREDWAFVRQTMERFCVRTVVEYGCGLSTELLYAMGIQAVSLETQIHFAKLYDGYNVKFCNYDEGYPDLEGKMFDMALVDGPGEKEIHDRSKSILHAKEHAGIIYLHDYNLNQFEHLDNDKRWVAKTVYGHHKNHLYVLRCLDH